MTRKKTPPKNPGAHYWNEKYGTTPLKSWSQEDTKVLNCKVYPMSHDEQAELNTYIDEHLLTGCIRPSKSLMASPCFFIKRKDGQLCFVQDYHKDIHSCSSQN
jgi:hypothetical protein